MVPILWRKCRKKRNLFVVDQETLTLRYGANKTIFQKFHLHAIEASIFSAPQRWINIGKPAKITAGKNANPFILELIWHSTNIRLFKTLYTLLLFELNFLLRFTQLMIIVKIVLLILTIAVAISKFMGIKLHDIS